TPEELSIGNGHIGDAASHDGAVVDGNVHLGVRVILERERRGHEEGHRTTEPFARLVDPHVHETAHSRAGAVDEVAGRRIVVVVDEVDAAHIDVDVFAISQDAEVVVEIAGLSSGLTEVTACPERHQPQRQVGCDGLAVTHEPVDHLVVGTIAATADDQCVSRLYGLARNAGGGAGTPCTGVCHVAQHRAGSGLDVGPHLAELASARGRIHNEKRNTHRALLLTVGGYPVPRAPNASNRIWSRATTSVALPDAFRWVAHG